MLMVYVNAMGGKFRFLVLMSWFLLVELCRVGATVWLSYWTGITDRPGQPCLPALCNSNSSSSSSPCPRSSSSCGSPTGPASRTDQVRPCLPAVCNSSSSPCLCSSSSGSPTGPASRTDQVSPAFLLSATQTLPLLLLLVLVLLLLVALLLDQHHGQTRLDPAFLLSATRLLLLVFVLHLRALLLDRHHGQTRSALPSCSLQLKLFLFFLSSFFFFLWLSYWTSITDRPG